jgi:ACT domain-containing protein
MMFVMDYPRNVDIVGDEIGRGPESWVIAVPPFHTGHLGFVPDTKVDVSLMRGAAGESSHLQRQIEFCEVLITPFARKVGELVRIECSMIDRPGVVEALIDAVSSLHVNIVTIESTIGEHPLQHLVAMIIDLSPSEIGQINDDRHPIEYMEFARNVPLEDLSLVRIFESIARRCGPVLTWNQESDGPRPRLRIRRVHTRRGVEVDGRVTVERKSSPSYHVRIALPLQVERRINMRLGIAEPGQLSYILVSETEERVLRAYFYRNDVRTGLFHLGCYHDDAPGALIAILKLVASAGFNIVTSLLRRETDQQSVWEALLEYRGTAELLPDGSSVKAQLEWAGSRLLEHATDQHLRDLKKVQATLGPPRYPKVMGGGLLDYRIELWKEKGKKKSLQDRAEQRTVKPLAQDLWIAARERLQEAIQRRSKPEAPSVFISFPATAMELARSLSLEFEKAGIHATDGMAQKGQPILDEIVRKIRAADYFLGIWHPDDGGGTTDPTISPWLPFELGVAMAERKPRLVVRHSKLRRALWNRIDPANNKPEYSDRSFENETIPLIIEAVFKGFPAP